MRALFLALGMLARPLAFAVQAGSSAAPFGGRRPLLVQITLLRCRTLASNSLRSRYLVPCLDSSCIWPQISADTPSLQFNLKACGCLDAGMQPVRWLLQDLKMHDMI